MESNDTENGPNDHKLNFLDYVKLNEIELNTKINNSNEIELSNNQYFQTLSLNVRNEKKKDFVRTLVSIFSLSIIIIATLFLTIIIIYCIKYSIKEVKYHTNLKKRSISDSNSTNKANTCSAGYVGDDCDIECGLSFSTPNVKNLKIVGGTTAVSNSWPSLVYVRFNYKATAYIPTSGVYVTFTYGSACGGTLIDRRTILTAAHCIPSQVTFTYNSYTYSYRVTTNSFYPTIGSMFTVYLGLQDKSLIGNSDISPAQAMSVYTAVKHESYSTSSLQNDIALLILSSNVTFNNYIQPACIPTTNSNSYPSTQTDSWAAGWGTTSFGGSTPSQLRNVKLSVYQNTTYCVNVSPSVAKNWNAQICAGEILGGKDTCQGDSGGPLYVQDNLGGKTKYIAAGVVSYGDGCASPGNN